MQTHFLHSEHRKKRLERRLFSDILGRPLEFIICLLNVLKNDFGEVDEVMFQDFERPCEHIFSIR
jgi:hypothetical protein